MSQAAEKTTGDTHAPEVLRRNIERVLRIEEHVARTKGPVDTITDFLSRSVGTVWFILVHCAALALWLVINLGGVRAIRPFDPFPFNLLGTVTSFEAVMLAAFILMIQTRMAGLADRRDHFDLQVNLMAEQEASMTIQMLDRISRRLGVHQDGAEEALALSRTSSLDHLAEELHARLPDTDGELPKTDA